MIIIDCFTFYNELELLEYRLNLLKNVVDYHVIVEATVTHVGKPKKMYFDPEKYEKYNIIYIIVDLPFKNPNNEEVWKNEKHQRNCIIQGLKKIHICPNDIIITSDLDEIPDPRTLHALRNYQLNEIYSLEQDLYYCTLENITIDKWYYAKLFPYKCLENKKIDDIRFMNCNIIKNGGWHLSYFGSAEHIANKIQNFVHQEFNEPEYTDHQKIIERISYGTDLFDRKEIHIKKTPRVYNDYLPYRWYLFIKTPSAPDHILNEYYINRCTVRSDINEHLPTLYQYSLECESIFETGVRGVISTYAFAYGLLNNGKNTKKLFVNDITECDISEISDLCTLNGISLEHRWCNNLHLRFKEKFDLTFIDTWHVYGQLKRELAFFKNVTRKYIIMHDTTIDAVYGESIRQGMDITAQSEQTGIPFQEICKGLQPAIDEFLKENTDWILLKRFVNNNGLTILKKNN